MADPILLDDAKIWLGGVDLTGSANSVELSAAKAELTNGRFGDAGEVFHPGLEQVVANVGGFFSAGAGEPDPTIYNRWNSSTGHALTVAPPNAPGAVAGAEGNVAYTVVGRPFSYNISGAHGQLLPYQMTAKPASTFRLYRQKIISEKQSFATTATAGLTDVGAAHNVGAVATGQELNATLHAFSHTGAAFTITVESDNASGFASATTRVTFSSVATDGITETKKVSGAITDNWYRTRYVVTDSGSISSALLVGIANQ